MERAFFKTPKILVIGDLMIDHYLWGRCERISPEAPVQVIEVNKESSILGGAGNVISNLLSLGAKVDTMSVVGNDEVSHELISMLGEIGVDDSFIVCEKGRSTSKKSRVMASNQQVIRYDKETKDPISKDTQDELKKRFDKRVKEYDAVLISDYAKGLLTPELTQFVIKRAKAEGILVLVDPKGYDYSKYTGATLITPNKKEASIATNSSIEDKKTLLEAATKLKKELELEYVVITLSEDGMAVFDKGLEIIPTVAREVYDVTGAGDTVLAALGVALACGLDINMAVGFANSAAAVVVGKLGSATANLEEIQEYESSVNVTMSENKILTSKELQKVLVKHGNKKIVFTNGCFDILHAGHISYLQKAKRLGDILILGLNSDNSVKRLKGECRPINNEKDRAIVLSAISFIDYVVIFDEDTPYELIKALKPNILIKGGDYKDKEVVGSDLVQRVELIDFVDGKSTTNIINKVKDNDGHDKR